MTRNKTVYVTPMGKPRMTRRDRWAKRPCVLRYHAFKDQMRLQLGGGLAGDVCKLSWKAYFPMPKSWSQKKRNELKGMPHRQKPDRDNIDKAILDAIFREDSGIARGTIEKFWDDGEGARLELEWGYHGNGNEA